MRVGRTAERRGQLGGHPPSRLFGVLSRGIWTKRRPHPPLVGPAVPRAHVPARRQVALDPPRDLLTAERPEDRPNHHRRIRAAPLNVVSRAVVAHSLPTPLVSRAERGSGRCPGHPQRGRARAAVPPVGAALAAIRDEHAPCVAGRFVAVAQPAQHLPVGGLRPAALRDRDDVIDLELAGAPALLTPSAARAQQVVPHTTREVIGALA